MFSIVLSVLIRLTASDYLLWYLVTIVLSVLIRLTASDYLLWYLQTFLRPLWNILRAWGDWIVESLIKTYINLCFIMSIYFLLKFLYEARKVSVMYLSVRDFVFWFWNYSDSVYFLFVFYFISKGRVYEVGMTSRKITTRDWYFKHILLFIKTKG